jgi:hypothetical protein
VTAWIIGKARARSRTVRHSDVTGILSIKTLGRSQRSPVHLDNPSFDAASTTATSYMHPLHRCWPDGQSMEYRR